MFSYLSPIEFPLLQACCNGGYYATKIMNKPLVKGCQAMKTLCIAHYLRGWPFLNSTNLFLIDVDPLNTYYILQEQQPICEETALLQVDIQLISQ